MINQPLPGALDNTTISRGEERAKTLSLSRVVATLQVVLATRRAARAAEHAARSRAQGM
jgi:hypothetical protein